MSVRRDVDAELRFHLDARIEELVAGGATREEARARAEAEFGDVESVRSDLESIDRRVVRRRNRLELFDALRQDVRYAARSLRKTPAVSLTIILTLALGLGVNAAMFSLLDVIFLRPPAGVARPGDVRRVWEEQRFSSGVEFWSGFDYSGYAGIVRAAEGQVEVAMYSRPSARKIGTGEGAPTAAVAGASANYFALLGVRPQRGRFYSANEDRVNVVAPVAVVSDAFWKRQFDGSAAIGQRITLANETYTIIGVAPPGFSGTELSATDVWLPLPASVYDYARRFKVAWWQNPNVNGFQVLLRLGPGTNEAELAQRLTTALRAPGIGYRQDTLAVAALGSIVSARGPGELRAEVHVAERLAGVAVIVLLIACANVINLLLARALRRRREIAVRIALGVSRLRLVCMLVTESVLLAMVATAAALAAAGWGGALLRRLLMPEIHFAESPMEWRVFGFAMVVAVFAGALAGLVPALQSASPDVTSSLKAGAREGGGYRSRLRSALVMCQAALSVVLLVGAVLFVRSLRNVTSLDVGYAINELGFARVTYDVPDSARDRAIPSRLRTLEPRIATIPGVRHVALTSMRPRFGMSFVDYVPDVDTSGRRMPDGIYTAVSRDYFAATGMKLVRGTTFPTAAGDGSPFTVIVNQATAEAIWPGRDPIGHCIYFKRRSASAGQTPPCARVIGVAQTAILNSINETPSPHFYIWLDHPPIDTWGATDVIVRAAPERMMAVQRSVTELLRAEFPGAIPHWTTMARVMEPEYRPWRLGATLFTLFGVLALIVAAVGVYSTISYAVSQRTHEFGVRIALGAQGSDVRHQVLGEGLRTVAWGVVLGILMALAAGRLIASLLYGIAPSDPVSMGVVALVLLGIAAIAALVPAVRASRADPVLCLRAE